MKNKKFIIILVAVLALAFLLGATGLVKLEKNTDDVEKGRMVGVFISFEDLGVDRDRVYAKLVNEENGDWNYSFESLEGNFIAMVNVGQGDKTYKEVITSGRYFRETYSSLNMGTDSEKVVFEISLVKAVNNGPSFLYCNPIYQTSNGDVYVVPGMGMQMTGLLGAGQKMSQSLNEKTAFTSEGKKKSYECDIKTTWLIIDEPVKVIVRQFDSNNQQIESQEYKMDDVPENIIPSANAEYIIVESVNKDKDGNIYSERELIGKNTKEWSYYTLDGIGMGVCHEAKVMWK